MKNLSRKKSEEVCGQWMTYTGKLVTPLGDFGPRSIDIVDIAHALSNLCRFNGHVDRFYSVAEHSCRVHDMVEPQFRKVALLHDATEAYFADIAGPVKRHPRLKTIIEQIEEEIWVSIADKFCLPETIPPEVKEADKAMIDKEFLALKGRWVGQTCAVGPLFGWTPSRARSQFLLRYHSLSDLTQRDWNADD